MRQPILTNDDLEKIRAIAEVARHASSRSRTLDTTCPRRATARRAWSRRSTSCLRRGRRRGARRHQHPDPVGSRASAPTAFRSRRCWHCARCTTI
ncbi:MAG: hypothetical protein MZV49_16480 [Rhodopseudomonas palustris]|nr:hypothetical protein [Rhodopseudomonas palustris]